MSPEPVRRELPRPPYIPERASFVDVVFGVTRGFLVFPTGTMREALTGSHLSWNPELQGWLPRPQGDRDPEVERHRAPPPRNVLRLKIGPHGWPPRPVEIESEVERLELVKYVFRDSRGFPLSPVFAPGSKLKAVGLPDVNHAIGRSDGALQFLEDCDKAIDEMTDPPHDTPVDRFKKKASRFFYNFDLHTSPVLWGYLEADKVAQAAWPGWNPQLVPDRGTVANAINHAMAYLTERVKDRVKKADVPAFPEFDKATQIYQDTKLLSELQLKLCSRVHGGLTAAQLRNAFSWFANGELRLPLPGLGIAVQPSCGYYFFFGEFALMAMDNSIAKRRWTSLARTLVRTQLVFAPSYAPSGGDGRTLEFGSYSSENFDGPKGDKDALRGEFNRLGAVGIASRASSNAKKHLGGIA